MFKKLTKTVIVLSALVLLLAGCGSADTEPTTETPLPNESAIHQESEPTDVHTSLGEADIDTSDWIPLEIEGGTVSIPPTWEYEYGNWGSLNFNGHSGTSDTIFMGVSEFITMTDVMDSTGRFLEVVNEADSSQEFVFYDGYVGFMLEYSTSISWVRSDSWMRINFSHGGARSHFVNNEDIITAIAKSFVTSRSETSTPTATSEAPDVQPPVQMIGTPVDTDIITIEELLIATSWIFEGSGGILSGSYIDGVGFTQNRFWSIDFFGDGTGELSDFSGEDVAEFTWTLIDDAENNRVVLNIFSVWLDPVAAHVGLWYEVSKSTLGLQQILTLHGDQHRTFENATIITTW